MEDATRILCCSGLWRRLAAIAPIRLLAWEPPYASSVALEKTKKKKKERESERNEVPRGREREWDGLEVWG